MRARCCEEVGETLAAFFISSLLDTEERTLSDTCCCDDDDEDEDEEEDVGVELRECFPPGLLLPDRGTVEGWRGRVG